MLNAIRDERKQIAARDSVLAEREKTLLSWLKDEPHTQNELLPKNNNGSNSPLWHFLEIALGDRKKLTTAELIELVKTDKDLIERYGEKPGRSVNALLQGWKQAERVHKDMHGRWVLAQD